MPVLSRDLLTLMLSSFFILRATDASTMEDGIAFEGLKLVFKSYLNFEDICVN